MCHSRQLDNKTNSADERALRIIYNDRKSSLKSLLEKEHSFTTRKKNLYHSYENLNCKPPCS